MIQSEALCRKLIQIDSSEEYKNTPTLSDLHPDGSLKT